MKRILIGTIGAVAILTLGACGGSGGNNSASPPPPPAPLAAIDSANAETVAATSVDVAFQSGGFGGFFGSTGVTASAPIGPSEQLAVQSANLAVTSTISAGVVSQGAIPETTTDCAMDGTLTISGEIADPVTLSEGDFFTLDWNICDDGLGQVIDGMVEFEISSFAGDLVTGEFLLGITLTLTNFQVTAGTDISIADGDITVTIDTRIAPISVATTSGSNFTVSNNGSSETLSNFSSIVSEDAGMFPSNLTRELNGTVSSSTQFAGSVSYETPIQLDSIGEANPYAGELLVTGANGANLRIIALDDVNTRIEADYDGDGTVDETFDTTWDAMTGL